MAYFENAKPAGNTAVAERPQFASKQPPGVRANKYAGKCIECGGRVEAGEGRLDKVDDKWVTSHVACPPQNDAEQALTTAAVRAAKVWRIYDGDYTLKRGDGTHRTFRVLIQEETEDFLPGRQIVSYLSGPNNDRDYTQFAHITANGDVKVWKNHLGNDQLVADVAELLANLDDEEKVVKAVRCFRCHRNLTVPTSVHNGYGPDCIHLA